MAVQIIHTDRYGDLKVVMAFHEGPRVIHLLENGCYVFDGGLPVADKKDLAKGLPFEFVAPALEWLEHKDDRVDGSIRAITVKGNNTLVFSDTGEPVTNIQDIIDFFDPGRFREAALIAFANQLAMEKRAKEEGRPTPPKKTTTEKRRESMQKINAKKAKEAKAKKASAPKEAAPNLAEAAAGAG